ncbi:MAG: response regulator [Hyphomicrobiales bacterium]|nr:response regulator [Hyphomicrobiales bacterium]
MLQEEIKALVIEDEEIWLRSILANLNDFGYTVSGTASNFEEAIKLLNTADYDIVLLDINLNRKKSGLELGKMVSGLYHKPYIFITASFDTHTMQEAIGANPSAYLTKPVNPASLVIAIQNAINNFNSKQPASNVSEEELFFFVKQGNKYKKLNWKDIVYLRSEKNYTSIFNAPEKAEYYIRSTMPKTLKYIIPASLQDKFIQVNRSEALNTTFIHEMSGDEVKTQFKVFYITDAYSKNLKKVLNIIS